MALDIIETQCSCERCSSMCHAPCCPTPNEVLKLIEAGYSDRLMFDDLEGGETMVKPALKRFEGKRSPWETDSLEGCTFWKDGLCELHNKGLKPLHARLVNHDTSAEQHSSISEMLNQLWEKNDSSDVIENWKEKVNYKA